MGLTAAEARELAQIARELDLRAADPLRAWDAKFTAAQRDAYGCELATVIATGGNQSGKSRWACKYVCDWALGRHPLAPKRDRICWYATVNYELFGKQPWNHFKDMLLFPGESALRLPTRRIEEISWNERKQEQPKYFRVRGAGGDGHCTHIYVMSYEQGAEAFASQTVDLIVLDEECEESIYNECRARFLANAGARMLIPATPVSGVAWLRRLKRAAIADPKAGTGLFQFNTEDNPAANREEIARTKLLNQSNPDLIALRLFGSDAQSSGLVYNDLRFTGEHVINDGERGFYLDPRHWTFNRCIDAGYRFPACVWLAVSSDERQVLVYRSWKGKDLTIREAWAEVERLSNGETYHHDLIDPEVLARNPETGAKELDVWVREGFKGRPARDNSVRAGIEKIWGLMAERVEVPLAGGGVKLAPRLRVLASCQEWLNEREEYMLRDISEHLQTDVRPFGVVKRNDHTMDPTRLLVNEGLKFVKPSQRPPEPGSMARAFWDERHPRPGGKL